MIGPSDRRSWLLAAVMAAALALALYGALRAQLFDRALAGGFRLVAGDSDGHIDWISRELYRDGGAWVLDARVDIELPPAVTAGLDSGIPLHFVLEFEPLPASESRWPWQHEVFRRRYSIAYYELTRHYRVHNETNGEYHNFRSLRSALDGLGDFSGLRFDELDTGRTIEVVRLRLRLDTRRLPLPLQPLLRSPWRLTSEQTAWRPD